MERDTQSASLSRCSSCMADLSRNDSCSKNNSNSNSESESSNKEYQTTSSSSSSSTTTASKLDLEPTKLFLSSSPTSILFGPTTTAATTSSTVSSAPERLYLPRRGSAPPETLDTYLSSLPSIQSRAEELWKCPNNSHSCSSGGTSDGNNNGNGGCCKQPQELKGNNLNSKQHTQTQTHQQQQHPNHQCCLQLDQVAHTLRCVTVLQGEVAHATSEDTDLLLSGEATTCHVLAVRSTTNSNSSAALNSIAHLDNVYSDCLDAIVQRHLQHHQALWQVEGEEDFGFYMGDSQSTLLNPSLDSSQHQHFLPAPVMQPQPQPQTQPLRQEPQPPSQQPSQEEEEPPTTTTSRMIHMELHVVGGYLDADGTSQGLTEGILRTLSELAETYSNHIQMHLSTAAVSRLNTCHNTKAPKSRGLALNVHTGRVHPITTALPSELEGPALELRNARMFASNGNVNNNNNSSSLAVIHDQGNIIIESFDYQPQQQLNVLLQVPDPILLQVTSTSPHCESTRFCSDMRRTVSFLNRVPSDAVFRMGQPLVYTRSKTAGLNEWESSVEIPSFVDQVCDDDGITF